MTRSQAPWQSYDFPNAGDPAGDIRERVKGLEVRLETSQHQTREDLQSVWSHMQTQDARITRNNEWLLHHSRMMADAGRALDASNAEHRRRSEQIGRTVKIVFAVLKWLAAVILIAASAMGKMTPETAKAINGVLGLSGG